MDKQPCLLMLTCKDKTEADKIASVLLGNNLIVCAKQVAVSSDFLWNGKVDHNKEVLLIMDSREDLFDEIEAEIALLHSYETFILQALPSIKTSKKAGLWMQKNLK